MIERFGDTPEHEAEEERYRTDGYMVITYPILEDEEGNMPYKIADKMYIYLLERLDFELLGGQLDGSQLGRFLVVDHDRVLVRSFSAGFTEEQFQAHRDNGWTTILAVATQRTYEVKKWEKPPAA